MSLSLVAVFLFAVVFILKRFIPLYISIPVDFEINQSQRKFEILSVVYTFIIVAGIYSGVRNINQSMLNSEDTKILVTLPIKPSSLLLSKLLGAYLKSLFTTALIILPLSIVFGIFSKTDTYFAIMSVVLCFLLPVVNIAVASILALPVFYIKKALGGRYLISLILFVALLAVLLTGYSTLLNGLKSLLEKREISVFFNKENMQIISTITAKLHPASLFANVLLKRNLAVNIPICLALLTTLALSGFFLSKALLNNAMKQRFNQSTFIFHTKERAQKQRSVFSALFLKEYICVMRAPSYAFQYFATALIMPLIVYLSLSLSVSLVQNLLYIDRSFELSLFVIMIFSVLTNTFCAINISREGKMFFASKALPLTHKQIVVTKVLFSSLIAVISLIACSIMIVALGYATWFQSLFIFFSVLCLAVAQIAFATRLDFNRPHFSAHSDGEITESNATLSAVIVLGLLLSLLIGSATLYFSMFFELKLLPKLSSLMPYVVGGGTAIIMAGLSILFLLRNLGKKYYSMEN